MERLRLKVTNETGLHARPASVFVKGANAFESEIHIRNLTTESEMADAKSILNVLALGVEQGHEVEIVVEGPDAIKAVRVLEELVLSGLGDESASEHE
jgi:phosphotransferase system HPr (HPr) family protein